MNVIRVLVADDDPRLRDAMELLINDTSDMRVVSVVEDGEAAIEEARRLRPDVALLDVRMPKVSGLEAARALARLDGPTRVVLLTMFDHDEYVETALQVGAVGFLLKNAPPVDITRAIRAAHQGHALLAPEVTRRLIDRIVPQRATSDPRVARLTDRERQTLTLVGRGASNDEIAAALVVTPTTARTYVSRLLTKLNARDRAQLVVLAYESGLTRPSPT